jgi:hypothetical protein
MTWPALKAKQALREVMSAVPDCGVDMEGAGGGAGPGGLAFGEPVVGRCRLTLG